MYSNCTSVDILQPQRATWIYTGYMVGGESFVGRWRDADSPDEVNGYEGPFAMKRRPRS